MIITDDEDDGISVNVDDDKTGSSAKAHLAPSRTTQTDSRMDVPLLGRQVHEKKKREEDTVWTHDWRKDEIYFRLSEAHGQGRGIEA